MKLQDSTSPSGHSNLFSKRIQFRIDDLLEKNLVAQKALRDLGTAPKLAQDSIKLLYGDME